MDQRPSSRRETPALIRPLADFLHTQAAGGILLVVAAAIALIWANSPWNASYESLWTTPISIDIGSLGVHLNLREWIADGFMTIFFLVVGLEIKRELTEGELASPRQAALPALAALGGMVVPAAIYIAITMGGSHVHGWGIPMATDIALAVGVLGLLGKRVPTAAKVFLLALAIVDDIGAILVIAVAYTDDLGVVWLMVAFGAVAATLLARRSRVFSLPVYISLGIIMWYALHEAGVHATLAGVTMGLLTPVVPHLPREFIDVDQLTDLSDVKSAREAAMLARMSVSVVEWLEHRLHPFTSFIIIPVFALSQTGIVISSDVMGEVVKSDVALGIALGLVFGKPIGITLFTFIGTKLGLELPKGMNMRVVAAMGAIAGMGFTVSLFVTELAFTDVLAIEEAKLSILFASLLAAGLGAGAAILVGIKPSAFTSNDGLEATELEAIETHAGAVTDPGAQAATLPGADDLPDFDASGVRGAAPQSVD